MSNTTELTRANKITSYWEGDGIAVAIFYKTHDKLVTIKSTDDAVIAAGFTFPVGTDEAPISATKKLEAFKTFVATNSTLFGITYDPVDRRADAFKFPGKYDAETFGKFAKDILVMALEPVLENVQTSAIDKMVSNDLLPVGSAISYGVSDAEIAITESYSNGNIKYGTATCNVAIAVNGKTTEVVATIDLVSGQLKKPRQLGETAMTMTSIKNMLIEKELLPKPVVKETTETVDTNAENK